MIHTHEVPSSILGRATKKHSRIWVLFLFLGISHKPPATGHRPPGTSHKPPATNHQQQSSGHQSDHPINRITLSIRLPYQSDYPINSVGRKIYPLCNSQTPPTLFRKHSERGWPLLWNNFASQTPATPSRGLSKAYRRLLRITRRQNFFRQRGEQIMLFIVLIGITLLSAL